MHGGGVVDEGLVLLSGAVGMGPGGGPDAGEATPRCGIIRMMLPCIDDVAEVER